MSPAQIPEIPSNEFSRCEERNHLIDHGKSLSPTEKTDAALKASIERALEHDDILRAIEYDEVDVYAKNGIVYLHGHIVNTNSRRRIENAIRSIPGILGMQNNLVLDDKLTLEVAGSLGELEHLYDCKFFTGASHGVISLNGDVRDEKVKLLAEQRAASHPNVRGVINNVHVSGTEQELQDQPFLQPTIGEIVYFLDWTSAVVKQVIINPNNRRVVAMILRGQFAIQPQEIKSTNSAQAQPPERLFVVPMDLIRYMTKVSGFLNINSNEQKRYMDFDPTHFSTPKNDWIAPHPYCPNDVLFPFEQREVEYQILEQIPRAPLVVALPEQEQALWELLANENLGG
jgi:osmotically-inducible protein OsmY